MTDLQKYVDGLFRHQPLTPEVKDLKEEILSNMLAKQDDLIAQGWDAEAAAEKAKESLSAVDSLIDGNQLTDLKKYHLECMQTALLNCIIFWIFSLPLLFTHYALFSYMGLVLVIISGCTYILEKGKREPADAYLSVTASKRRGKTAWMIWGVFFLVAAGTMAALTFGSDIWFGRPLNISGPYQLANLAVVLFCLIQFWIIPADQAKKETYARNQTDALTHDISAIEDYRTAYLGDAANVTKLFGALPLNNIPKQFEINSDDCTLTVNYLDTVCDIGEDNVHRDLVYNTVAAMAAIDNLSGITYNFSGDSYSFDRKQMEDVFGAPLSDLLEQGKWSKNVQDKLKDAGFVGQFYKATVQPSG